VQKPLDPAFSGFGRVFTNDDGSFRIITIKPGRVAAADGGLQAPHLNVTIFARGLLKHLITRMYFPNDAANESDAVLQSVPAARRATLIATPIAAGVNTLRWDVVLQGDNETVFFEY
jgi:protocatechuate 3,4-dioxygenase alpha subunit